MPGCSTSADRAAAVLLCAGSLAVGCRFEAGTGPAKESPSAASSAGGQCLASPLAAADSRSDLPVDRSTRSTLIHARLASRLIHDGPSRILCLAPDGARWVLRWEMEP